ncbi:G protein-coupled receptor 75 [Elysia marginata]|uniref:G protein-coupled receptor 75 n=1 Tax=Elysia marginata TaxID=1093978 RepID=A0AAV4HYX7_9GAST|nr:G protein-coupled receptor 75 [Elysia marginata]
MPVVLSYNEAIFYPNSNVSSGSGSSRSISTVHDVKHDANGPVGMSAVADWDPSFHGSVHTATMAVCTVLVIFVVVLGTFGNGLVLITALQCRRLRSNFDVFVYNLAGADFIVCSCLAPTFLFLLFSSPPPAARPLCGGFLFVSVLCGLASLLTLLAIACHRQSRVTGRAKGALTARRTAAILGVIYVVSSATALGGTLHATLSWPDGQTSCQAVINSSHVTSNNVILFFVTPVVSVSCVTILVSYCIIARAVRTQSYLRVKALQPLLQTTGYSRLTHSSEDPQGAGPNKTSPPCSDMKQVLLEAGVSPDSSKTQTPEPSSLHTTTKPSIRSDKRERLRHCTCCSCMAALDKENKAISMCLVVILIIALCWTPLVVSHVIELFTGDSIILYQVKLCGIALVFLNSALDPYMYAQNCSRSSSRYASFLWEVFRCECRLPRHSKRNLRSKTSISPGKRTTRNPVGLPSTAQVLRADCATLQFLHPTDPPLKDNPQYVKHSTREVRNSYCIFKSSKSGRTGAKPKHHRVYSSNILKFAHINLPTCESYKRTEVRNERRTHAHASTMSDVRTLVHKSCCHGNVHEDLSLIDR